MPPDGATTGPFWSFSAWCTAREDRVDRAPVRAAATRSAAPARSVRVIRIAFLANIFHRRYLLCASSFVLHCRFLHTGEDWLRLDFSFWPFVVRTDALVFLSSWFPTGDPLYRLGVRASTSRSCERRSYRLPLRQWRPAGLPASPGVSTRYTVGVLRRWSVISDRRSTSAFR